MREASAGGTTGEEFLVRFVVRKIITIEEIITTKLETTVNKEKFVYNLDFAMYWIYYYTFINQSQ